MSKPTLTDTLPNDANSGHAMQSRQETRAAARILAIVALVAVAVAVATVIWGLPALTMSALGATVLVFVMLVAYAAGV